MFFIFKNESTRTLTVVVAVLAVFLPFIIIRLREPEHAFPDKGVSLFQYVPLMDFRYLGMYTLWISTILVGFGSELFVARVMIHKLEEATAHHWWVFAQVAFPFCLTIAVFSQSIWGLPFLVLGLWKMGFPETATFFVSARNAYKQYGSITSLRVLKNVAEAVGTVLHHSATTLFVCSLASGAQSLADPSNPLRGAALIAVSLPLVFQHWFTCLKYFSYLGYCFAETSLEIWWELEVFANYKFMKDTYMRGIVWAMLIAHWLYFTAGFLAMREKMFPSSADIHERSNPDRPRHHTVSVMRKSSHVLGAPLLTVEETREEADAEL